MKTFRCLLIAVLFPYLGSGQISRIDSLRTVLAAHKKADTARVSNLAHISYQAQFEDPDMGLSYGDSALTLAKRLNSAKGIAQSYLALGANYTAKGSHNKEALEHYAKAESIAKRMGNMASLAHIYHGMAYVHSIQGENKRAISLENQAYELLIKIGKRKKAGIVLNSIGANYFILSDYNKALEFYLKSLKIAEETQDDIDIASAYENIGLVYKRMHNLPKAFHYLKKSVVLFEKADATFRLSNVLTSLGSTYDLDGKSKLALEHYGRALLLARKSRNVRSEYSIETNIAIVQYGLKNYDAAFDGFKKGRTFFSENHDHRNLSVVNQYFARLLFDAPDSILAKNGIDVKMKYAIARDLLQYSLDHCKKADALEEQMNLHELLAKCHEHTGNHQLALSSFRAYTTIRDSLHRNENREALLIKEHQYESQQKASLAAAEIERQKVIKNASIGTGGILLCSGIFFFIGFRKRQRIRQNQKELLFRARISDTELKVLRLQMNPHFIFNSLNSIGDYIQKNDIQSADYFLSKFAKLMRGILENSEVNEIPLSEELKMIELYIQLEASRLRGKFSYSIKIHPNIDPDATMVPPLILQPFVENSIWHGLAEKQGDGHILIEVSRDDSMLNCVVEDNGTGRQSDQTSTRKSYGVKITRERIALLNKLKNTDAAVNLIDLEKGTRVELTLPIETQ